MSRKKVASSNKYMDRAALPPQDSGITQQSGRHSLFSTLSGKITGMSSHFQFVILRVQLMALGMAEKHWSIPSLPLYPYLSHLIKTPVKDVQGPGTCLN